MLTSLTLQSLRNAIGYMMYGIMVFENLRFRPSTRKREAGVVKNLQSGNCKKTCVIGARKRRLRVEGRLIRRKNSSFWKISGFLWTASKMYNIFLYFCIKGASTSTDSSMEGPSKVTLIYFIGGCTHAEISALRFLARQDNSKFDEEYVLNTSVLFLRKSGFTLKKHLIVRITCATP